MELAARYAAEMADELVFLDITATVEKRKALVELVKNVAREINIPFTVGGGISAIADVSALLNAGADKVSINSSAVKRPQLIDELAKEFGNQCVVVAIDSRLIDHKHVVHTHGGRTPTEKETVSWAMEAESRGAGEILLTSMDHDGTKSGFATALTALVSLAVGVPVIASGGGGSMQHFYEIFENGKADAALAASIFHFQEVPIKGLKEYLRSENIPVRL